MPQGGESMARLARHWGVRCRGVVAQIDNLRRNRSARLAREAEGAGDLIFGISSRVKSLRRQLQGATYGGGKLVAVLSHCLSVQSGHCGHNADTC
jgi:hypothetical protein